MKSDSIILLVEEGIDKGMEITVPPEGIRIGRSSKNDVKLNDPLLSRHHCRVYIKTDDGLWITDLGSANKTIVNGKEIDETRLHTGDTIVLGDTVLRVLNDTSSQTNQKNPHIIDLGLDTNQTKNENSVKKNSFMPWLLIIAGATLIGALAAWLPKILKKDEQPHKTEPRHSVTLPDNLWVSYEKVEADTNNIFRYFATINNGKLTIEIDDLENNRHIAKEKELSPDSLKRLTEKIKETNPFDLKSKYIGHDDNVYDKSNISIVLGDKILNTKVLNYVHPQKFKDISRIIEKFGEVELQLFASHIKAEDLEKKAKEAFDVAKSLYQQKEVALENLSNSILKLKEAQWYLESLQPRPKIGSDIDLLLNKCEEELNKKYDDLNFKATRAIRLQQWPEAANYLRTICELIPDRNDKRNKDAKEDLLNVESKINNQ